MLSVLRQRALCHPSSPVAACRRRPFRNAVAVTQAARPPPPSPQLLRRGSTSATGAAAAAKPPSQVYKYPEWLNVYRLSSNATLCLGFSRVFTLVVFGLGAFVYAPTFYFSPHHSNWMVPAFILASAVPMVAVVLASGPSVHSIKLQLPKHARSTREGLLKLASNVPPHTRLRLESMKLIPWPTKTEVYFSDLTRHKPSWKEGLSNLEYTPLRVQGSPDEGTVWHSLFRRLFGKYFVQRDQSKDRSQAPGVWDKIWEQIPEDRALLGSGKRRSIPTSSAPRTELKPLPPARPKPKTKP